MSSFQWFDLGLHVEKRKVKPFEADDAEIGTIHPFDLKIGKRVGKWDSNACLRSTRRKYDGVPDDVLSECLDIPTFSDRLRKALEKHKVGVKDIQYLPIQVFKSSGEELTGYSIANIVFRVAALDYDNTDWGPLEPDEDEIDPATGKPSVNGIWQAALYGAKLKGHDIIRLVEFAPAVYVSERFANVYNDGEFTGATLVPITVS